MFNAFAIKVNVNIHKNIKIMTKLLSFSGKIISSWIKFIFVLRKQFYPLAYTQTSMIEWLHIR